MTVTVHFIDLNWSLQEFVLETYGYEERHTGANIACQLQEAAERWNITDKVCTVVHDQVANNVLAMMKGLDGKASIALHIVLESLSQYFHYR